MRVLIFENVFSNIAMDNKTKWQPFIYGLLIAAGITIGIWLKPATGNRTLMFGGNNKFTEVLNLIQQAYVDTVNLDSLEEETLNALLNKLDPHSVYIPAKDLQMANEQLEGNFEGIGVEFSILNDTIMVVSPIEGGPSKELGILAGDRIVKVDTIPVAGVDITNEQVFKLLRGPKGTKVKIEILRSGNNRRLTYEITRNTIPIYSVDVSMMIDNKTGYIKISRFAADTHKEFIAALDKLKKQNMQQLIIDLRGNPGGYLSAATAIADELLDDNKLIVYTKGRTQPRSDYNAERKGLFENGKLAVLIDEGSASASEILSGAMQDWDRGVLVGRRSFGKGLVQEPFELKDGSVVRLTVSRYYTPSGRCIQKPYHDGYEAYEHELLDRMENGELKNQAQVRITDTTTYFTSGGRKVYAKGGIMPDYFVPLDTSYISTYLLEAMSQNLLNRFAANYLDLHRSELMKYGSAKNFNDGFQKNLINEFVLFASQNNLEREEDDIQRSGKYLTQTIKALIARGLWRDNGYFTVMNTSDKVLQKAFLEIEKGLPQILKP